MLSLKNKIFPFIHQTKDNPIATILPLWFILRFITSLWVALVSTLRPFTEIEKRLPLWPPSSHPSDWLERAIIAPWQRWDTEWYEKIITKGYHMDDGTAQFHPLYPWLATPLARLGFHPVLSLLFVSSISSFLLLLCFLQLARCDLSAEAAQTSTILLTTFPVAMILFAPYPEALFLTWAVLCLLWARRGQWVLAGASGALAMLTRQQGIFLTIPLAWELWEASGRSSRQIIKNWRSVLTLIMIPAGWLIWIAYRAIALNDIVVKFNSFHSLVYSLFISPSANQVVTEQQFIWPWQAIIIAFNILLNSPDVDIYVNLLLAIWFIIIIGLAWRKMRTSYRLYCFAITWISLSYYTGPVHPYMGLPRHLFLAFPVFIGLAPYISKPQVRLLSLLPNIFGMIFLLWLFVLEGWVP